MLDQHQYSFDCAVSLDQMTADIHTYFIEYARFDVDAWYASIDGMLNIPGQSTEACDPDYFSQWQKQFSHQAQQKFDEWFYKEKTIERAHCVNQGVFRFRYGMRDLARSVISQGVNNQMLLGINNVGILCNQMLAPDILAANITTNREFIRAQQRWAVVEEKVKWLGLDLLKEALDKQDDPENDPWHPARWEDEEYIERARDTNEIMGNLHKYVGGNKESQRYIRRKMKLARLQQIKERKVAKKAVKFLGQFAGQTTTRLFISGKSIKLEGKEFDFEVKKGNIFSNSHGAIKLTVCDKAGEPLVDLCWYISETPAPEQLAGLMMHVFHGDEREILKTANIIKHRTTKDSPSMMNLLEIRQTRRDRIFTVDDILPEGCIEVLDDDYDDPCTTPDIDDVMGQLNGVCRQMHYMLDEQNHMVLGHHQMVMDLQPILMEVYERQIPLTFDSPWLQRVTQGGDLRTLLVAA